MAQMQNNPQNPDAVMREMGKAAKEASRAMASLTSPRKNALLLALADALEAAAGPVLAANAEDLALAKSSGMAESLLDRLALDERRLAGIASDVRAVSALPDPVGEVLDGRDLDSGLFLMRRRVPLGVVAAVYEARPNVTVDVTALCLKTGNAVILRGGKETVRSNAALVRVIQNRLAEFGLPEAAVQAVNSPDRELVTALLHLDDYVDMLIPRGGPALHRLCRMESRIPVITGGIGVCHIIVHDSADIEKSLQVIENAKIQRPSACNALETLLVVKDIAPAFMPRLAARMSAGGVFMHVSETALPYLAGFSEFSAVEPGDYDKEWLTNDLNVHVLSDLDAAFAHIRKHGTGHSEAILSEKMHAVSRFVSEVDAAALYVNASTRFTDGGQFGLGAEVAISTQKLHARGPMGLDALTTYKWIAYGNYTTRA